MKKIIFIFLTIALAACKNNNDIHVPLEKHNAEEIGWEFEYPTNWRIMTENEIRDLDNQGISKLGKTIGQNIEMDQKYILGLEKGLKNVFTSVITPNDIPDEISFEDAQPLMHETLVATYKNMGLDFDYDAGKTTIDGLEFYTFQIKIYKYGRRKPIMTQMIYSRLINNTKILTLNLSYSIEDYRKELFEILRTSKFSIRD